MGSDRLPVGCNSNLDTQAPNASNQSIAPSRHKKSGLLQQEQQGHELNSIQPPEWDAVAVVFVFVVPCADPEEMGNGVTEPHGRRCPMQVGPSRSFSLRDNHLRTPSLRQNSPRGAILGAAHPLILDTPGCAVA